ncbi:ABC transporter substrate-binding protein [Jiangella mangrovi]|uniref:Peptide/nickel transport system substrate-binding protein n=1 Tax=Jiangella mangrovi TaxID=1524084 RepID=A0A7W9GX30_9ACTN|nr:ABC transporter substrate-binding protein [Jiangella mangrovi]MBB5791657.1 peptide/nickel transport system substrate-binding protein [Jiangella mangrovi]
MTGLTMGAAAVGLPIAACTSESASSSQDQDAGESPDSLAVAMANPFSDLDPTTAIQFGTITVNDYVYESLYSIDKFTPRSEISPEIAVGLPEEITPTTYRLTIRDDVRMHDGSTLAASDVVYTINRIKDPETASPFAQTFEIIAAVRAPSATEIEIELTAPTTRLAERLALIPGILSEAAVTASADALVLEPVGSGPLRVVSAVSGERISLERFTEYTGAREFHYERVDISVVADANARISGLRTGQFRAIEDVPASAYEELSTANGIRTEAAPSALITYLMCNCGKPPFDDVRVRQAVAYAIDRDSVTQSSFFGQAEPAWAQSLSAEISGAVEAETVYRHDPERARELLAEAGYGDQSVPIDVLVTTNVEFLGSQGPIIEENLRSAGFEPNMIPGEGVAHVSRVTEGNYGLWLGLTDPSVYAADAEFMIRFLWVGTFQTGFFYWLTPEATRVQELLRSVSLSTNDAERERILEEVQNIIQDEVPIVPLHFKKQITAWDDSLDGFKALPAAGLALDDVQG